MSYIVTLLYPVGQKPFDLNYYLKNYMTLVQKRWEQYGLQDWEVVKLDLVRGNQIKCILRFKDEAGNAKAVGDSDNIIGDIPNYTDTKPAMNQGVSVGGGKN
ncbi:hypothetical protein DL95DRAFT_375774 [Leptodontidium sp. 2 PMI_412]|nr:hypothetical protein DL95DRAFT_375774 [Leptodontidium sp. 2 PMI_412]